MEKAFEKAVLFNAIDTLDMLIEHGQTDKARQILTDMKAAFFDGSEGFVDVKTTVLHPA